LKSELSRTEQDKSEHTNPQTPILLHCFHLSIHPKHSILQNHIQKTTTTTIPELCSAVLSKITLPPSLEAYHLTGQ
jgi:hypothetical protein